MMSDYISSYQYDPCISSVIKCGWQWKIPKSIRKTSTKDGLSVATFDYHKGVMDDIGR